MITLVTGPEASGNRMLCRMITEAGGVILHRPMPMSTHWRPGMAGDPTSWDGVWTDFAMLPWNQAVVIHRDFSCTVKAQVAAGHVPDLEKAIDRTRRAITNIYTQLNGDARPWWTVTYESLARPEAVKDLCSRLGLDYARVRTVWQDANAKHYGGEAWEDHDPLWSKPVGV